MSNREIFIKVIEELFETVVLDENDEDIIKAQSYFEEFKNLRPTKEITEKGTNILTFMQKNEDKYNNLFTAKMIGEGLFMSSRSVSGSMRKLINEGFIEKIGVNPVSYKLTEKGENK